MTDNISVTVTNRDDITATVVNRDDISVTITGGFTNNFVDSDTKFYLNGYNGNTYFIYNSSRNKLELYVNGSIRQDWP